MKDCVELLLYDTSGVEIGRLPQKKRWRLYREIATPIHRKDHNLHE